MVIVITVGAEPAVDYYRSSAASFSFVFFDPVYCVLQEGAVNNPRAAAICVQADFVLPEDAAGDCYGAALQGGEAAPGVLTSPTEFSRPSIYPAPEAGFTIRQSDNNLSTGMINAPLTIRA